MTARQLFVSPIAAWLRSLWMNYLDFRDEAMLSALAEVQSQATRTLADSHREQRNVQRRMAIRRSDRRGL